MQSQTQQLQEHSIDWSKLAFDRSEGLMRYSSITNLIRDNAVQLVNPYQSKNENKAALVALRNLVNVTKHNSIAFKDCNFAGMLTDWNIQLATDLEKLPWQQKAFLETMDDYYDYPELLPYLSTTEGFAPAKRVRSMVSSVFKVILLNTCFYTKRIGRYTKFGFEPISVLELARQAGFTYIKNGDEVTVRAWQRAFELITKSGYIYSLQQKIANPMSSKGWQRSHKFLSDKFFDHIFDVLPGLMPKDKYQSLVDAAKKRHIAKERKKPTDKIISKVKLVKAAFDDAVQSKIAAFFDVLKEKGFCDYAAKEAAALTILSKHKFEKDRRIFGPPQTT